MANSGVVENSSKMDVTTSGETKNVDSSLRSTEEKKGNGESQELPNGKQENHRRTASAGHPVMAGEFGTYGFVPPPQIAVNLSSSPGNPFLDPKMLASGPGRATISDPIPSPKFQQPQMFFAPPPGSPYLSGRSRGLSQDGVPAFFAPQADPSGSRRKRKMHGHRRTKSYSEAYSYGSIQTDPGSAPAGRGPSFSPRSEFFKLAEGLRSSPAPPSPTGSQRGHSPPPNMMYSTRSNLSEPPVMGFSPAHQMPSENGSIFGPGSFESIDSTPRSSSRHARSDSGGEAVFLVQKKGKHRKTPSTRKMHMRQRSAQLFMENIKGVQQIPSCRDILFLMLFVFHLLGIVYLGNTYGYEGLRYHDEADNEDTVTIIYQNLVYVSLLSGGFAVLLSSLALLMMMALAKQIVKIALILTITLSFAWGTIGIGLSPKKVVPATGIIALALTVAYTVIVWERCKFHGSNLYASLTGISKNPWAIVVAFVCQFLSLGWSIYYVYVAVGVYDAVADGDIEITTPHLKVAIFAALAVSYYWTLQVFMNIVHVTVARVIGHWWYKPDGAATSVGEVVEATFHSCFYAIGSICFGSLVVGPVRLLRQLSALFRPSSESSSLLCFHECIYCVQNILTSCVDALASRFNPWAFTYIGLYGYDLMSAGLNSTELFEKRGWTTIVSDDLVPNVLLLTILVIGGVTGCFAHAIENIDSLALTSLKEPILTSFVVGAVIGVVVSSVLFGIISSSVNAVIVCFAASPVDFDNNHPELSADMRTAWREVWPGCMDVVDMRMAVASYLDGSMEQQPLL